MGRSTSQLETLPFRLKSLHGNTRRENSLYPLDRRRKFATEGLFPTVPQIYIFVKPAKQVLQSVRILQRRMCHLMLIMGHDGDFLPLALFIGAP